MIPPTAIRVCTGGARNRRRRCSRKFGHLEHIPEDAGQWRVNAANAASLAATLVRERDRAYLFRTLATLRTDLPLFTSVDELKWNGPTPEFAEIGMRLDNAVTAESTPRPPRARG